MSPRSIITRALVGLAILLFLPSLTTGAPPIPVGQIQQVGGRVVLTRGTTSNPVSVNQGVFPGDRLVADREATAVVRLDRHLVRMGPGSTLIIARADIETQDYSIFLWAGRIWLYVLKGLAVMNFEVETPAAIAGVRGTLFSVEVAPDGTTWIGVAEGRVAVRAASGQEVELAPDYGTSVKPGGQPDNPKKLKPGQVGGDDLKEEKEEKDEKDKKDKKDKEK